MSSRPRPCNSPCPPGLHGAAQRIRGLTLVELLVGLSICLILLGSVAPHFGKATERRQLQGAAAQLATDIHQARGLAVASASPQRISFRSNPAGSCYIVHDGPPQACQCDSSGQAACAAGTHVARSVFLPAEGALRLQSNVGSIQFHPHIGTTTPTGTLRLQGRHGQSVHLVVNIMGRTRVCSPNGVPGYPPC